MESAAIPARLLKIGQPSSPISVRGRQTRRPLLCYLFAFQPKLVLLDPLDFLKEGTRDIKTTLGKTVRIGLRDQCETFF